MKNKNILSIIFLIFFVFHTKLHANETLDYTIEHLQEAEMNARFQCLPDVELNPLSEDSRIKLGFVHFDSGPSTTNAVLTSIQKSFPQNTFWSSIFSIFYDYSFIKTRNEVATTKIIKNQPTVTAQTSSILLEANSAHAHHLGIGIGEVHRFNSSFALEGGLSLEVYDIRSLNLKFTTVDEPSNYSGNINYNHTYLIYVPHLSFNWFPTYKLSGLNSVARMSVAYPLPRQDLPRVVHVGNNQLNLKAGSQHIPDGFIGIGYALESPANKWRLDIGATLDFLLFEGNVRHKGITTPILISYSFTI